MVGIAGVVMWSRRIERSDTHRCHHPPTTANLP